MKKEDIKTGKIYYTTNVEVLTEVISKIDEVKKNDILKEEFIQRLGKYIFTRTGMVLVSFDEKKELTGCMVISRQLDKIGEFLWIDFAYISAHCPDLRKRFYNEIIDQCRKRGIKRIQMRMSRGAKAMNKLFGTKEIAKILEREVI